MLQLATMDACLIGSVITFIFFEIYFKIMAVVGAHGDTLDEFLISLLARRAVAPTSPMAWPSRPVRGVRCLDGKLEGSPVVGGTCARLQKLESARRDGGGRTPRTRRAGGVPCDGR